MLKALMRKWAVRNIRRQIKQFVLDPQKFGYKRSRERELDCRCETEFYINVPGGWDVYYYTVRYNPILFPDITLDNLIVDVVRELRPKDTHAFQVQPYYHGA